MTQYYKNYFDKITDRHKDITPKTLINLCKNLIDGIEEKYSEFKNTLEAEALEKELRDCDFSPLENQTKLNTYRIYILCKYVPNKINGVCGLSKPRLTPLELDYKTWYFKQGLAFLAGARYSFQDEKEERELQGFEFSAIPVISRLDCLSDDGGGHYMLKVQNHNLLEYKHHIELFYETVNLFNEAIDESISETEATYETLLDLWEHTEYGKGNHPRELFFEWAKTLSIVNDLPLLKAYPDGFDSGSVPKKQPTMLKKEDVLLPLKRKNPFRNLMYFYLEKYIDENGIIPTYHILWNFIAEKNGSQFDGISIKYISNRKTITYGAVTVDKPAFKERFNNLPIKDKSKTTG